MKRLYPRERKNRCVICKTIFSGSSRLARKGLKKTCSKSCQQKLSWKVRDPAEIKRFRNTLSRNRLGVDNPNWKGNKVGYAALHGYIKRIFPKPKKCNDCKKYKPLDLANISQKYLRDIKD